MSQSAYAYEWNTLPKYVYQNAQGEWKNFEHDIVMLNQLVNPVTYYNQVNVDAKVPLSLELEEICIFYVFNRKFQEYMQFLNMDFFVYSNEYGLDSDTERVFSEQVRQTTNPAEYQNLYQGIERAKGQFRRDYENVLRERQYTQSFGRVPRTAFQVESVVQSYHIDDVMNRNIYAYLDQIVLSEQFPLAVTPRFYKVLKGYEYTLDIPDEECVWLFSYRGKVVLYPDRIEFTVSKDEDASEYFREIVRTINIPEENFTPLAEKVNGTCMYPRQRLDTIIWRDLVMNNRIVAQRLVIDEHRLNVKVLKRKVMFVYHFTEDDQRTTLTIKEDDEGVRLRIVSGIAPDKVEEILDDVASALAMYNALGTDIAKIYNDILGQRIVIFESPMPEPVIDYTKPLKIIAPDMFLANYTRKCQFLPRIVPQNVADEIEATGNQVMQFPKPQDSLRPLLFTCEHHRERGFIYPGLRLNPLENKTQFPILPCCYQENQSTRNTLYKQYYESEKPLAEFGEQPKKQQYRFLISDKFVGLDQTGKCSESIQQLFALSSSKVPYRKGVHRTRMSVLECILLRINFDGFAKKNAVSRLATVKKEFERLQTLKLEICAQECWNIPHPRELLNEDIYLDPRYFIRLLEYVYQCQLVLLSRTDFIHPNYVEGYLRWETSPTKPIVVIFEHMGSESDNAEYPQCELVEIAADDNAVYQAVYKEYVASLETVHPTPSVMRLAFFDALDADYILLEQHIDFYGKVYALNVQRKDESNSRLTLFLNPTEKGASRLPPMYLDASNIVYYSSSMAPNLSLNRVQLDIGDFNFFVYVTTQKPISKLGIFENLRTQANLLFENAKRLYAATGTVDFIRVSPTALNINYSKYTFLDTEELLVPDEETRRRLIFALKLFAKRFNSQLNSYLQLEVMPFKYESIQDFAVQSDVVISRTDFAVNWFTHFYTLKPIDGTLYTEPFVCEIQNVLYKCTPVSAVPESWGTYRVLFPQIRRTFWVNTSEPPNETLLVIQNRDKINQFYTCLELS